MGSWSWSAGVVLGLLACTSESATDAAASIDSDREGASTAGVAVVSMDPRLWCIHEDDQGDLWFGSNGSGVYRYNGHTLVQYTTESGLAGDTVRGVHGDGRGGLLVSTTDGVSRFDGERWSDVGVVEHSGTDGWRLDPDDVWLVFTPGEGGPCRFDGERLHRLELTESPALETHRKRYPNSGYKPDGVYSVYEDRRGHVWFGTASVGLCRYDGSKLAWLYEERLSTAPSGGEFGIRSIFEDSAGDFWICNTRQRFQFEEQSVTRDGIELLAYSKRTGLPEASTDEAQHFEYYHSMVEDADGALWMACGGEGVWKYDGEVVTRYAVGKGSEDAYAIGLCLDRSGRLWLGTLEDGVFLFGSAGFVPFQLPKSLQADSSGAPVLEGQELREAQLRAARVQREVRKQLQVGRSVVDRALGTSPYPYEQETLDAAGEFWQTYLGSLELNEADAYWLCDQFANGSWPDFDLDGAPDPQWACVDRWGAERIALEVDPHSVYLILSSIPSELAVQGFGSFLQPILDGLDEAQASELSAYLKPYLQDQRR